MKLDTNRKRFPGMCLETRHDDHLPVSQHSDLLLKVRVPQDEKYCGTGNVVRPTSFDALMAQMATRARCLCRSIDSRSGSSRSSSRSETTLYKEQGATVLIDVGKEV